MTDTPNRFKTIADIKAYNRIKGYNFFSKDTMRFWQSVAYPKVWGNRFFITSEQFASDKREYAVRCICDDGTIQTLVAHLETRLAAETHAKGFADSWRNVQIRPGYDECEFSKRGVAPEHANDVRVIFPKVGYRPQPGDPVEWTEGGPVD